MPKARVCKYCGKYLLPGEQVCHHCGGRVRTYGWLWLTLAFLAVVGAASIFVWRAVVDKDEAAKEGDQLFVTPEFTERVRAYEELTPFSENLAAVCRDGLWGYIDALGSEIVPCAYEFASDFHDNYAVTGSNGVFTVIDAQGNPVTFYREEEAPLPPPPEEDPQPEEEEPLILPEKETPSGQKTSVGTIIAIVLAGLFLLFLATAIILREVNIRRRRRRRLISRGRGKHGK